MTNCWLTNNQQTNKRETVMCGVVKHSTSVQIQARILYSRCISCAPFQKNRVFVAVVLVRPLTNNNDQQPTNKQTKQTINNNQQTNKNANQHKTTISNVNEKTKKNTIHNNKITTKRTSTQLQCKKELLFQPPVDATCDRPITNNKQQATGNNNNSNYNPTNQPTKQATNQTTNQPTNQPGSQPTNHNSNNNCNNNNNNSNNNAKSNNSKTTSSKKQTTTTTAASTKLSCAQGLKPVYWLSKS